MKIFFVVPDYFETPPEGLHERAGLGFPHRDARWHGAALPCRAHAARAGRFRMCARIGAIDLVRLASAFNRFRGNDWMKEPCRSCPEKTRISAAAAARRICLPAILPMPIQCVICRHTITW